MRKLAPAAAFALGNADGEQAFAMHVAEGLDRKRGFAIMPGCAGRQHAGAEGTRLGDQRGLARLERNAAGSKMGAPVS